MSLPLLVNGAECGPLNPLQGLSKRFEQDRGIQQDHFGAGRAGSSKETFRTQYAAATGVSQDAAKFFSSHPSPAPLLSGPSTFDLSALHNSLPASHAQSSLQAPPVQSFGAPWAADFLQQPRHTSLSHLSTNAVVSTEARSLQDHPGLAQSPKPFSHNGLSTNMPWNPSLMGYNTNLMSPMAAQTFNLSAQPPQAMQQAHAAQWDQEFHRQEVSLSTSISSQPPVQAIESEPQSAMQTHAQDADELARTAALLIDTVSNEENPKFKNSQFMGLMRQLRDREVVIEGNDMVQRDEASGSGLQASADVKGKGRAVDTPATLTYANMGPPAVPQASSWAPQLQGASEQDNDDYIKYWEDNIQDWFREGEQTDASPQARGPQDAQAAEWDKLQRDWIAFEAGATGMRPVSNYQFQANNPYFLGEASRMRHHAMHSGGTSSLYESVLEMEAAVQRDPTNARGWFELGVRQQENEREQKAVHALRRALELDPSHLASWLALAVSHTNEGNRQGAYSAIREWVERNERYAPAVAQFRAQNPSTADRSQTERFAGLMQCLMSMVRSNASGEIDADIQIALAVLLNTNEEYDKAQDCFTTALAVRPDDWLLYNRVGATLANSGRAEDALQYYYRALELNPAYIRARFNLGISCINLRRYEEAAQHILDALVLQDSDSVREPDGSDDKRGVISSALWDSLKTCCMHMQRLDLATLCDHEDLEGFRLNFQMQ
ncbi:Peroxisomal targeting signal 1 receptor [Grifola frondosa]|uniref:Peroxisomal targeting signal 1 receptor n=1 Tax=Grifola frondosa TaxID=5627 RepID=A0A1C7LU82_GRIFR|nr:Peroxisomal targeting signal 1 receptor [Grifola frondosa]